MDLILSSSVSIFIVQIYSTATSSSGDEYLKNLSLD